MNSCKAEEQAWACEENEQGKKKGVKMYLQRSRVNEKVVGEDQRTKKVFQNKKAKIQLSASTEGRRFLH